MFGGGKYIGSRKAYRHFYAYAFITPIADLQFYGLGFLKLTFYNKIKFIKKNFLKNIREFLHFEDNCASLQT